jgi:hypothetical protein
MKPTLINKSYSPSPFPSPRFLDAVVVNVIIGPTIAPIALTAAAPPPGADSSHAAIIR